jgi:hypothetical protein
MRRLRGAAEFCKLVSYTFDAACCDILRAYLYLDFLACHIHLNMKRELRTSGYIPLYVAAFLLLFFPYGFLASGLLIALAFADMLFGY